MYFWIVFILSSTVISPFSFDISCMIEKVKQEILAIHDYDVCEISYYEIKGTNKELIKDLGDLSIKEYLPVEKYLLKCLSPTSAKP